MKGRTTNRWNRRSNPRKPDSVKSKPEEYKVTRVRPKRRKAKHAGFTVVSPHRLWIFEK
jgi:hypothetical protein